MSETPEEVSVATNGYVFNQTMMRIQNPKKSLVFYQGVLGFTLVKQLDFPDMLFSLYFLAYSVDNNLSITGNMFGRSGVLELTHNYGTETDTAFKGYHNGNDEPKGFGHIGVTVPDVQEACERFERLGVDFIKRPDEGNMKGLAFIRDPDGYWVEILSIGGMDRLLDRNEA